MTRNKPGQTCDLFEGVEGSTPMQEVIANGAVILRGFALDIDTPLLAAIQAISDQAPFRHMTVPGGRTMSVAITNCGSAGWVSDRKGYRYDSADPDTGRRWPLLPECFTDLAARAAAQAGYADFIPDACLMNCYAPGAGVSLHQDKDERDFSAPIVSVSLGLPATFMFGGPRRNDKTMRYRLAHGDVVVWGGPSRLMFHGIVPLKEGEHTVTGRKRFNLTFRKAL